MNESSHQFAIHGGIKCITDMIGTLKNKPKSFFQEQDAFIQALDKKVWIDSSHIKYKTIYDGVDIFTDRIVDKLRTMGGYEFSKTNKRLTGSISAGVKVALPHEVDYLLEIRSRNPNPIEKMLPETLDPYAYELSERMLSIMNNAQQSLLNEMPDWILHGVYIHDGVPGVCLLMEYRSDECIQDAVGITVDLILIEKVQKVDDFKFHKNTENYLSNMSNDMTEIVEKSGIYQVVASNELDTGNLGNEIIRNAAEPLKQAFRVAKYLLQYLVVYDKGQDGIYRKMLQFVDEITMLRLFGYKPYIRSYRL